MSSPAASTPEAAGESNRERLLRNFSWNFLGRSWQTLLTLVSVPFLVHRLGTEVYGAYALIAVFLSYFAFLDFGFSSALERFAAAALGAGDRRQLERFFRTTLTLQLVTSCLGGAAILLLGRLALPYLKVEPAHRPELADALFFIAASFALTLSSGAAAGLLRAQQRFGVLNRIGIVNGTLSTGLLLVVAFFAPTLGNVVRALVLSALVGFAWTLWEARRSAEVDLGLGIDREAFRQLFGFGGFLTLNGLVAPLLVNVEKLMMGALLNMHAVTYYMVPYRALQRLTLLPASLRRALFPYLSSLHGKSDHASIFRANARATELLAWLLLPFFAVVWVAGPELLGLWMGEDFARQAAPTLLVLSVGWFLNMLAWNSVAVIHACGRPELQTAVYVLEAALYVPLAYTLMSRAGILGAAIAWCLRVAVDAVVQWSLAAYLTKRRGRLLLPPFNGLAAALAAALVGVAVLGRQLVGGGLWTIAAGASVGAVLLALGWSLLLEPRDRGAIGALMRRKLSAGAA